ncbi:MAG: pantetheine-phosphate adenylyltransferase [Thermoplasmata archaeon]|nr:pantetheine-phosphate adenylyltransferase [Thermoplasmata archaeon]
MRVIAGGTFNVLHRGHRLLLAHAASIASHLGIGITSDTMASGARGFPVRPFRERKRDVERLLEEMGFSGTLEIREIGDRYGFSLEEGWDILVASRETKPTALEINSLRAEKGLSPIRLHILGMVLADDALPLSSSRILAGEIDTEGHLKRPVKAAVGSLSPPKAEGVRDAFSLFFPSVETSAVQVEPPMDQPMSIEEILMGARKRAEEALPGDGSADYGVGIEHGVVTLASGGHLSFHLCVVADRRGLETVGVGPGFPVPGFVLERLSGDGDMSSILGELLGVENLGSGEGITGLLSEGRVVRRDLVKWAVVSAMVPRMRMDIYDMEIL